MHDNIQRSVDPVYHNIIHFCKIIIQVCRDHPILATTLTNFVLDTFNLIVNYKVVYKCLKERYLDKNEDDELYLMDYQYWKGKFETQSLYYHRKKRLKELREIR